MSTEAKIGLAVLVLGWIAFAFLVYCACVRGGMEDDMAGRPRG